MERSNLSIFTSIGFVKMMKVQPSSFLVKLMEKGRSMTVPFLGISLIYRKTIEN